MKDGRVTALKVRIVADVGVPATLPGWAMSYVTAYCLPGAYKVPNTHIELFTVVTNKCPWNAYRGYGKEAAAFLMDRVMDRVADATNLSRADVRLANFIQPHEFPFSQATGAVLDSGDYPKALRRALETRRRRALFGRAGSSQTSGTLPRPRGELRVNS